METVKWTCTEDCHNIVKKNNINFDYNNDVPLGTCHAYTDIKKIDNNILKCTEDKNVFVKGIYIQLKTQVVMVKVKRMVFQYIIVLKQKIQKKCIHNLKDLCKHKFN